MPNLNLLMSADGSGDPSRSRRAARHGALFAANTRARSDLGHAPEGGSQDVRGQTLRLLRMQQDLDPVELATRACISLRQLYQLESGEYSLFYSEGLRNQAGRRVARMLGVDWDDLGKQATPTIPDVPLKLVETPVIREPVLVDSTGESCRTLPSAETERRVMSTGGEIPLGLAKPAVDTVCVDPADTARAPSAAVPGVPGAARSTPVRPTGMAPVWWVLTAVVAVLVGVLVSRGDASW